MLRSTIMNRRIVPFSLVIAGSLLAYACSSSDDTGGTPTPGDEAGTSSGSSGTSGTSGSSGEGGTDGSSGSDGSSSGGASPIDGIGAPAAVIANGQPFAGTFVFAPIWNAGNFYFAVNGADGNIVDYVPGVDTFALAASADPVPLGMTFDKKSSKIIVAAGTIGGAGGGQILGFTPLAAPPKLGDAPVVTPAPVTINWGDSGATGFDTPSDLVAKADGTLYVSDGAFQYKPATVPPNFHNKLWRLKPGTTAGTYDAFKTDVDGQPNGIALSSDEKTLYLAITNPATGPANIMKYPVGTDGAVGTAAPFANVGGATAAATALTGLAIDGAGNVYAGYTTGVDVFKPDGTKWGTIPVAKPVASVAFGGADLKTLFIGAGAANNVGDLYTVTIKVAGLAQ